MRIQTIGALTSSTVLFTSLFNLPPLQVKMTTDAAGKETPKLSPDGRPVYRTQLKALALDESGSPVREERNVSVGLLEPCEIRGGQTYALDGLVWMTPYNANGQPGISVIAERIVPVAEALKLDPAAVAAQISAKRKGEN